MKKHCIYLATVALAAGLAACSSDELEGSYRSQNGSEVFKATIEQGVVSTTRVAYNDDNLSFKWEDNDEIAVFNADDNTAYEYQKETADGDFGRVKDKTYPADGVNGKYAFYPFSALVSSSSAENSPTVLTRNAFYVDLDGVKVTEPSGDAVAYSYTSDDIATFTGTTVKMPMVSDVDAQGNVKFKNLTALMQVIVKNIPSEYDMVVLQNTGSTPIAGRAKVDVVEQTLTMTQEGGKNGIAYSWTTEESISTKIFYFIIPEGEYSTGFDCYLDKTSDKNSEAPLKLFEGKKLSVKRNYIYSTEVTLSGDGTPQSAEIETVNNELASGDLTVDVDLSKVTETNAIIILPRAYKKADGNTATVTLNLSALASSESTKTITIMEDQAVDGETYAAAKNVVINGVANEGTLNLDIQLPNSKVTLGLAGEATSTNYNTVDSQTGDGEDVKNILVINKGVTIADDLTINAGDVFLKDGASLTDKKVALSEGNANALLIYETGGTQTKSDVTGKVNSSATGISVVPEFVYDIEHAVGTVSVDVTEAIEDLTTSITVPENANVTLDLKGKTLKSSTSVLSLAKNATLTIQNTVGEDETDNGIIESTSTSAAAITIEGGSKVNLTAGTVKNVTNDGGQVVSATGEGSKFTLSGGSIVGLSNKNALYIADGATTELTGGKVDTGIVRLNAAGTSTIGISLPNWLISEASSAKLTVNDETIALGSVRANGSEIELTVKSLKGVEVTKAGSLKLNKGTIANGSVKVDGSNSKFTMVDGSITYSNQSTAVITATAGTIVDIQGGTVAATGTGNSALSLTDATATISGAATQITASGAEAIVDVAGSDKSTLNINGGAIETKKAATAAIKIANGTEVTITDGTITAATTGEANAINITNGKLTVTGDGEPVLTGATTISAVPASDATVEVYLDAAGATYNANKDSGYYAVFNHASPTAAGAAIQSISGGHFNGDIISDQSLHFIEGGYFKNCTNLEKNEENYTNTTKKLGTKDSEGYWGIIDDIRN
jgi:hypothetical protein